MKRSIAGVCAVLSFVLVLPGCATLKPPTLVVEGLHVGKLGISGAAIDVSFKLRNPNPDPMLVERFEYELFLNGNRLGRGYEPNAVNLAGFAEERVRSRFDMNFLSLPGAVKDLLNDNRAKARVKGHFFVKTASGSQKKLPFDADASVDIGKN
jgi:LEA14-like dessication related protein